MPTDLIFVFFQFRPFFISWQYFHIDVNCISELKHIHLKKVFHLPYILGVKRKPDVIGLRHF